jgi:hypothetical protein
MQVATLAEIEVQGDDGDALEDGTDPRRSMVDSPITVFCVQLLR